jgi:hypothetical protein
MTMTRKMKKDLAKAGNMIARKKKDSICNAMHLLGINPMEWQETEEAQLVSPFLCFSTGVWWGMRTMNVRYNKKECRGARLIGIAMMITMPKEIVEHKCY